jgi:integrase
MCRRSACIVCATPTRPCCCRAGVPIKVVSERLAHATIAMTLDVYAHVLPAMDREAAGRFGQLLDP